MSEKMYIKPARLDAVIRFPDNPARQLKAEGEKVPASPFWTRRLMAGDVVEVKEKPAPVKPTAKIKEAKEKPAPATGGESKGV